MFSFDPNTFRETAEMKCENLNNPKRICAETEATHKIGADLFRSFSPPRFHDKNTRTTFSSTVRFLHVLPTSLLLLTFLRQGYKKTHMNWTQVGFCAISVQ